MKELYDYALRFVGIPYISGGNNPIVGFDCSGLVCELMRSVGVIGKQDLTAQQIFDLLHLDCTWNAQVLGSLVFYGSDAKNISHVSMMIDPYRVIEAGGGDHTTTTKEDAGKRNAFVRIRHLNFRADRVAIIRPNYSKIGILK